MTMKDRIPIVSMIFLFGMSAITFVGSALGFFSESWKPLRSDLDLISLMFFFAGSFVLAMQKWTMAQRKLDSAGIK